MYLLKAYTTWLYNMIYYEVLVVFVGQYCTEVNLNSTLI